MAKPKKNGELKANEAGLIKVTVAAAQPSRWCIKKQFTPEPQTLEVTEAELEELEADDKIIVVPAAEAPAPASE